MNEELEQVVGADMATAMGTAAANGMSWTEMIDRIAMPQLREYERTMYRIQRENDFRLYQVLEGRMPTDREWAGPRWTAWYTDLWPWSWARPLHQRARRRRFEWRERRRHAWAALRGSSSWCDSL